jgi:hypothetical protein
VEYGGFLDIGDTELPVPLNAFRWGIEEGLILNFDETRLEAFPDLGAEWPNLTDPTWEDNVVEFWRNVGIDPGFSIEEDTPDIITTLSDLLNSPIEGVGVGESMINNLLIDLEQSRIKYVVLSDTPLVGEQLVAIPYNALNVQVFEDAITFSADIEPEVLEAAPLYDAEAFIDTEPFGPGFDDDLAAYWAEQGFVVEPEQD